MVKSSWGMCDGPSVRPALVLGALMLVAGLVSLNASALPPSADTQLPAALLPSAADALGPEILDLHAMGLANGHVEMRFVCPDPSIPDANEARRLDYAVTAQCPFRVYDSLHTFGSPDLAVHQDDQREVMFVALHGAAPEEGHTDRSRTGQTHTTFLSDSQGIYWQDTPTGEGFQSSVDYGEHASIAMDSLGNAYIAFTHSQNFADTFSGSRISLLKNEGVEGRITVDLSYDFPTYVHNDTARGEILATHMTVVKTPTPADNGTDGSGDRREDPDTPFFDVITGEHAVAMWRESVDAERDHPYAGSGFINASWSQAGTRQDWIPLAPAQHIGPCDNASNPVPWDGKVYVACTAGAGYDHGLFARRGDVDVWSLDITTGETELVANTGLDPGQLWLSVNEKGRMLAISHSVDDKGFHAQAAFGYYGGQWGAKTGDFGSFLRRLAGDREALLDASITAAALGAQQDTAVLVYKEWVDPPETPGRPDPSTVDPERPPAVEDYRKVAVVLNACDGIIAAARMHLGVGMDPYHYQTYLETPELVNDNQDGLQMVVDGGGRELAYFAINDYGAIQYGAIDTLASDTFCTPIPPLPATGVLAAPQALTTATGASTLYGAALGIPAALMIGYLLTVKRRQANVLATEAQ